MISSGVRVQGGPPPIGLQSETQSYYVLFDTQSSDNVSHIINVDELPVVITAYNLSGLEEVDVYRVIIIGPNQYATQVFVQGQQIKLTATNNVLVLNISGLYQFVLSAGLGSVVVVAQDATLISSSSNRAIIGEQ